MNIIAILVYKLSQLNNFQSLGTEYVSNKMLIQFHNFSVCLNKIPAKNAKDSAETSVCYVSDDFCIPQHFSQGYNLVF